VTPAEERAARENLPVVTMTNFDLLRICSGHPMICSTADGREVLVRLLTVDEMLVEHEKSCRKYGLEPSLTRAKAAALTAPITVGGES
jgi:hypothetical protein